ncbi:Hypothetical predicted protein [Scomber scombrus]|uniref:Uncharacterized protein n=1 Tax=Scomber scombrus TaxID=13677 RepID=A0AAV1NHQ1_SCOSC
MFYSNKKNSKYKPHSCLTSLIQIAAVVKNASGVVLRNVSKDEEIRRQNGAYNKLRPLFVVFVNNNNNNNNNNNTGRGKHVALQNNWSPAVDSKYMKGELCSALPPQPSARGRMSTFSQDPLRELDIKINAENKNSPVGCYSVKPPSPLSHSKDTAASPSAIPPGLTDGQMDGRPSQTRLHTRVYRCVFQGWEGRNITVQMNRSSTGIY